MTFNRRQFLQAATLAALSSGVPLGNAQKSFAASSGSDLKLGLVTYQWGKDWDIPTLIKNCTEAGFRGVELRTEHKHGVELHLSPAQRAEVRKQFEDSPVAIVGLGTTCEYHSPDPEVVKKNIEETKAWIRLSHEVGGTGVKVRPNGLPSEVPVEKTVEQIGRALNEVAAYAQEFGQDVRVEVHGKGTQEIPVMHQIMQVADHKNAVVCWNCNKTDLAGAGLAANFKLLQDRIRTVHIHDLTVNQYPWEELFTLLKPLQWPIWTLIEEGQIPKDKDIVTAMKQNREVWEKLVAQ